MEHSTPQLSASSTNPSLDFCPFPFVCAGDDRTLAECFSIFALIHELTTEHSTITRIAREAVEDFASDRVVYLELRTTPKVQP